MTKPAFSESERTLKSDDLVLRGTLCLPEKEGSKTPDAIVLMLSGSGDLDRNGNGLRLQLNIFNAIGQTLAENNIASYRYDKRGCGESDGNYLETGYFDLLNDAREALKALQQWPEASNIPVLLLGHSEGTLMASMLANEGHDIDSQILINPFLDRLEKIIEQQIVSTVAELKARTGFKGLMIKLFLFVSGDQVAKQQKIMKRVKRSKDPVIKVKRTPVNAKWLRDHMDIDPLEEHSKVNIPTLSIGGSKDLQCSPEDAKRIASLINAPVEAHVLDDLTHILRFDEESPSTFRYRELTESDIDPRVCELIVKWIASRGHT